MITKLTTNQQSKFTQLMDQWVRNSYGQTNHDNCTKSINAMYAAMNQKVPALFHFTSPFLSIMAASIINSKLNSKLDNQLGSKLYNQLYDQLNSKLDNQLYDQLYGQLNSQLGNQLYDQLNSKLYNQHYDQLNSKLGNQLNSKLNSKLYDQLDSQLHSQLGSQLYSQLGSQLRSQLRSQLGSHYIVEWWGTWACYYEFGEYTGVKFDRDKYDLFHAFVRDIHSCIPYKNVCIYSDKPIECHFKGNLLHNESDMSVKYADGWGWYSLNGVMMQPEHILTKPDDMKPDTVLSCKNVDQRRELLKKFGIQRLSEQGKVIDENDEYKLIDMSSIITTVSYAPYLLMENPSLKDTSHMEGVHEDCKTIEQAINWRAGDITKQWKPVKIS